MRTCDSASEALRAFNHPQRDCAGCQFWLDACVAVDYPWIVFGVGSFLINLGIIFFSFAVLFQLVTLPVEFNASRRAVNILGETRNPGAGGTGVYEKGASRGGLHLCGKRGGCNFADAPSDFIVWRKKKT